MFAITHLNSLISSGLSLGIGAVANDLHRHMRSLHTAQLVKYRDFTH
jgi:hypothetical protein